MKDPPRRGQPQSLEGAVLNVPKLSFPIAIRPPEKRTTSLYSGQNGWFQSVLYSEGRAILMAGPKVSFILRCPLF